MFIIKVLDYRKENKLYFTFMCYMFIPLGVLFFLSQMEVYTYEIQTCLSASLTHMDEAMFGFSKHRILYNCHICSLMGSEVQLLRLGDFL